MSEPKSIEEVPSWVIVNALKCPVEAQISIVAKLLKHLDSEQRNQAFSMSGVVGQSEQLVCDCKLPTSEFELNTGEMLCCKCEKPKAN